MYSTFPDLFGHIFRLIDLLKIHFLFLDYEHVESAKFKEYERLEGDGYDEAIKDDDHDKLKKLHTPGLGHDPRTPRYDFT